MTESRIKISSVLQNQLPEYIKEEFPLVQEFLSQYYIAIENQGGVLDILQNIDQYIKVDTLTNVTDSTTLSSDVSFFDKTIEVDSTYGFPDSYGLLKVGNEIITYKSKTSTTFNECIRGFVGIEEYLNDDQLVFTDSNVEQHSSGDTVSNLSVLFLKEFFYKVKKQISPGFEDRQLDPSVNERLFIKQVKDFYSSKGTEDSFELLFRALYGKDVEVILPRDRIIHPSGSDYRITKNLIVEAIEGDPEQLKNLTLYQDQVYDIKESVGTISNVEKIVRGGKDYYLMEVDFGYDTQLDDTGLAFGEFSIHPSTRTIVNAELNSDTLTVDSTLGFPSSGDLKVRLGENITFIVSYTSKSVNQFFGCTGVSQSIPQNTELNLDVYAYGFTDLAQTQTVKVKITGVLSDLILDNPTKYYASGDIIKIKTLGKVTDNFKANNWLFNVSTTHNVKSITELDSLNFKYQIDLYDPHTFYIGDSITVIPFQGQPFSEVTGTISIIKNTYSFVVSLNERINSYLPNKIRKNIVNVNSSNNLDLNKYTSNVQNVYYGKDNSLYVTSNCLPSYVNVPLNINDRRLVFSGSFNGEEIYIRNHKLYTGDVIVYNPQDSSNKLNLSAGKYFVRRINSDTIKLSRSRNNLSSGNYITVNGNVTDNIFYPQRFTYDDLSVKTVESQKLIREIKNPSNSLTLQETPTGFTGIFLNGVELLNYKSTDYVYYGQIEDITIENAGDGYDVINPPSIEITDTVGSGASVYCNVNGNLSRIDVVDTGVSFLETPRVVIVGGNGRGASAQANLTSYDYSISFNPTQSGGYVDLANNTIGFSTYHQLSDGEEVIYQTSLEATESIIGGITTNSSYYVSVIDSNTVKLHTNFDDALRKINPLNITLPYGKGTHTLKSKYQKRKLQSIDVISSGANYRNRRIKTSSSGISTANNSINITNHGFNEKDIIVYEANGSIISGISTSKLYYVSKIDDNSFRLAEEYLSDDNSKDFNYTTGQFVNLTTVGSGTHIFKDQPIQVSIEGTVGISTFSNENFRASVQPIFRGSIESVVIEDGGENYGSEDILNYNRLPEVTIKSGTGIQLLPVTSNGSIAQVIILNAGSGYNSPPNLVIESASGIGAILTPIVRNGSLIEVKVIYGGVGYVQGSTTIRAVSSGDGGVLQPKIKSWNVNLVERIINSNQITEDDGILENALYRDYGLQYSHAYAPRNLRKLISTYRFIDDEIFYSPDLTLIGGREVLSSSHSPIIGWAYDGNPIYGPYGYSTKSGGPIRLLKSGYKISLQTNRPSTDLYPEGFFVEDYQYVGDGDLDECNGRYCFTPEYPNGTYAYFSTIAETIEASGPFSNYRRPLFPYVIGNYYKSVVNGYNLSPLSNQDKFNINSSNWIRNTNSYCIANEESEYDYLLNPNKIKNQDSRVVSVRSGIVTDIVVINSSNFHSPGRRILIDNEKVNGDGASAYVYSIGGVDVVGASSTTIVIDEVKLISSVGFSTQLSSVRSGEIVTIRGKYPNEFITTQPISYIRQGLTLSSGIASAAYTGIVTYIDVYSTSNVRSNDLYSLGTEVIKVLNIDSFTSRLRILRNQNNTQGLSSFSPGLNIYEIPTKFSYDPSGINTTISYFDDYELYFNPSESLGIGTTAGIGVGVTVYFSNPGVGATSVFIQTQTIYLPNHNLKTGTKLLYNSNQGTPFSISTDGVSSFALTDNSILYAARISDNLIGISTVNVGLGSTGTFVGVGSTQVGGLLYLVGIGTGVYHSFRPNADSIVKAEVSKNLVTLFTKEIPDVFPDEEIDVQVISNVSTAVTVFYNDYNRRIYVNPKAFISSNVNLEDSSIRIENHPFKTGQKVLYRETTPVGGLVDNSIYYIINYGQNLIKLSSSLYNTTINNFIGITSTGSGTISAINPQIISIKNSPITFSLSDSSLSYKNNTISYPAFKFTVYSDPELTREFEKTPDSNVFEVVKTGRIGVDANATVTLSVNSNFPETLYYRLEPVSDSSLPDIKREIVFDDEIPENGEILLVDSNISGNVIVSGVGTTSFTYVIPRYPEIGEYNAQNSDISYEKYEVPIFRNGGKIKKIKIENKGYKYKSLPTASLINGVDILKVEGQNIGAVNKTNIIDIGFSYPVDHTLRPTAKLPEILNILRLSAFDTISIQSNGFNYNVAPNLIVIDNKTNEQLLDVELSYELGDEFVKINKNTSGIYNITPTIIPINNTNAIGISSMTFDSVKKYVTVYLTQSFSNVEDFPFDVGSRVLVEGVGIASTSASGYNSEDYGYALFNVVASDPNIGGANGSVVYDMSEYLSNSDVLGAIQTQGFIVPESYFPTFGITLKKLPFYVGETVESPSSNGTVQQWDVANNNLKVATNKDFKVGEIVRGKTSGAMAIIDFIYNSDCTYNVGGSSTVRTGWINDVGFLNENSQRTHDNDYYQYFAYELRSEVPYDQWNNSITRLNHTAGFKKFSNLILPSTGGFIGLSTSQEISEFTAVSDIYSVKNLHCFDDFDLVSENNITLNGRQYSDKIIFNTKILQDYIESVGNRVLKIDNISSQFNSNPRPTRFSVIDTFNLDDCRSKKYIIYITDRRYVNERETLIVTLLHDGSTGYINQYARVETAQDLGYFDFSISGNEGNLLFYPNKSSVNNYNLEFASFGIRDTVTGIGTQDLGDIVKINTSTSTISVGSTTATIVGIASTYRSAKVLVQIGATDKSYFEFNEITVLHDDQDVFFIDYGELTTGNYATYSSTGIGTYHAYLSGSNLNVDFILNNTSPIDYDINTIVVSIANSSSIGIGTTSIGGNVLDSNYVSIASSTSPIATNISQHEITYNSSYYVVCVEDTTNNNYQISEVVVTNKDTESYITEYGILESNGILGDFDSTISGDLIYLNFTPIANIDCEVRVFKVHIGLDDLEGLVDLNNATINSHYGLYRGTDFDVKREFNLTHNLLPIFEKNFDASLVDIVNVNENTIYIPGHYFVTGEEVEYYYEGGPIGIATTTITGIGTTDKLPSSVYIVKVDDLNVRVCASASESLLPVPNILNITSVGIGSTHSFIAKNQNSKALIAIDNVIQSPIVSTAITTTVAVDVEVFDDKVKFSGITSFFGGDLIKIGDEIMKITSVGIGSTNIVSVIRPWMGTGITTHGSGALITKVRGNYNIVDNVISFADAPYGNVPVENPNKFDETDYTGISTSSTFSGRIFLRSGVVNSSNETYDKNYIFDDISGRFNGFSNKFTLTSEKSNIAGFSTSNAIVLINSVFQLPSRISVESIVGGYDLSENSGISSITFVGTATSITSDINASNLPRGGIIVSVGSSKGFGYQPLVSAGGTAIVSVAGTIQSISIGNSGSGYRSGLQVVNVGVGTSSLHGPNIEFIGTATVSNGHVVSVAITNPGTGYTSTNLPYVFFDAPLSYNNIPLVYSSESKSGVGTEAVVDVVVGQGSSVISFEFKNYGYGYDQEEILTIPLSGSIGIPTDSSLPFEEFQITIERTYNDEFSGWTIGDLQVIDPIDSLFDGKQVEFPITVDGNQTTIRSKKGSNIDVEQTLLVFINDILQVPGEAYIFKGGSVITFTEPPIQGDTSKILFYKGTGGVDTISVDVIETVKRGDKLQINSDQIAYQENERLVTEIVSTDVVKTNVYPGPGIIDDPSLLRPVTWCKQLTDIVVNNESVTKDRTQYEPYIYPNTNIIQPITDTSTEIYVESVKTFFDSAREYVQDGTIEKPQRKIAIISQENVVSASATAIVSIGGSITSINITDGGVGYSTSPIVTLSTPIGIGTTAATATASVTSGVVTSITVTYSGYGYTTSNPPQVLIESPSFNYEEIDDVQYEGDFGIIVGISTTSVGVASTGIVFDLFIPSNSYIRDTTINQVGIATTGISGIQTGYYFVVNNSNVGNGLTSLNESGNVVGLGSTYIDNIYQAVSVSIAQTSVLGIGTTYVTKVTVSVANYNGLVGLGYSNYYGNYTWGRLSNLVRKNPLNFQNYNNGISGISTSPLIVRINELKYLDYIS